MTRDLAQELVQAIHVDIHNVEKQKKNMVHSSDHHLNEIHMTRELAREQSQWIRDRTLATDEKNTKIWTKKKVTK
eukprot:9330240-Prorocentrum_lima.AAC.1